MLKICMKLKFSSGDWTYQQPRVMTIKWILHAARKSSGPFGVLVWGKFSSLKWGQHGFLYMHFTYTQNFYLAGCEWAIDRCSYTLSHDIQKEHTKIFPLFSDVISLKFSQFSMHWFLQNVTNALINHLFTTFDFIGKMECRKSSLKICVFIYRKVACTGHALNVDNWFVLWNF